MIEDEARDDPRPGLFAADLAAPRNAVRAHARGFRSDFAGLRNPANHAGFRPPPRLSSECSKRRLGGDNDKRAGTARTAPPWTPGGQS